MENDSARDMMIERILTLLSSHENVYVGEDNIKQLACSIADESFSVFGISDKEQEQPWKP